MSPAPQRGNGARWRGRRSALLLAGQRRGAQTLVEVGPEQAARVGGNVADVDGVAVAADGDLLDHAADVPAGDGVGDDLRRGAPILDVRHVVAGRDVHGAGGDVVVVEIDVAGAGGGREGRGGRDGGGRQGQSGQDEGTHRWSPLGFEVQSPFSPLSGRHFDFMSISHGLNYVKV